MEKTMMLPAYCNVMSPDEMVYTEGGATMGQALCALLLPPYGWFKACTANTLYGIGCAYNFVALNIATSGVGLIPAAYIIFKK